MVYYLLIFIIIAICGYNNIGKNISKNQIAGIFAFLALFVGCSDMLGGYDRYIYGNLFDSLADTLLAGNDIEKTSIYHLYGSELGYVFSNVLISFLTSNRYIFILIYTIAIYFFVYKAIVSQTNNYLFATLIFLSLYFFFTFTYLRQALAIAILWNSTKYIVDRKLIKFLICVAIATSFHNSALIFLPVYWICCKRFSQKQILCFLICCMCIGLTGIPSAIFDVYGDIADNQARAAGYLEDVSGFRIEYVLEALFFVWIILYNYKNIPDETKFNVQLNLSLIFCAMLLIFCKSINGGRLSWPFIMGVISTTTYIMTYKKYVTSKMLGFTCVLLALYVRILLSWGVLLYPYKTFFTDGYRDNDYIHLKNEYDHRYDINKFYR
jgi:hypothetical protein